MSEFTQKITKFRDYYKSLKFKYDSINELMCKYEKELNNLQKDIEICDKASVFITTISLEAKKMVIVILEDMVTEAIASISEGRYSFKIQIEETAKGNKCEFYIVEEVDGEISMQNPKEACGGGFIDIISTTLRYVYLNVFKNPSLNGPIILDEPAKMLSSDMSYSFGEFIKKLGGNFDRQTIIVTHNDELGDISDNSIKIIKDARETIA